MASFRDTRPVSGSPPALPLTPTEDEVDPFDEFRTGANSPLPDVVTSGFGTDPTDDRQYRRIQFNTWQLQHCNCFLDSQIRTEAPPTTYRKLTQALIDQPSVKYVGCMGGAAWSLTQCLDLSADTDWVISVDAQGKAATKVLQDVAAGLNAVLFGGSPVVTAKEELHTDGHGWVGHLDFATTVGQRAIEVSVILKNLPGPRTSDGSYRYFRGTDASEIAFAKGGGVLQIPEERYPVTEFTSWEQVRAARAGLVDVTRVDGLTNRFRALFGLALKGVQRQGFGPNLRSAEILRSFLPEISDDQRQKRFAEFAYLYGKQHHDTRCVCVVFALLCEAGLLAERPVLAKALVSLLRRDLADLEESVLLEVAKTPESVRCDNALLDDPAFAFVWQHRNLPTGAQDAASIGAAFWLLLAPHQDRCAADALRLFRIPAALPCIVSGQLVPPPLDPLALVYALESSNKIDRSPAVDQWLDEATFQVLPYCRDRRGFLDSYVLGLLLSQLSTALRQGRRFERLPTVLAAFGDFERLVFAQQRNRTLGDFHRDLLADDPSVSGLRRRWVMSWMQGAVFRPEDRLEVIQEVLMGPWVLHDPGLVAWLARDLSSTPAGRAVLQKHRERGAAYVAALQPVPQPRSRSRGPGAANPVAPLALPKKAAKVPNAAKVPAASDAECDEEPPPEVVAARTTYASMLKQAAKQKAPPRVPIVRAAPVTVQSRQSAGAVGRGAVGGGLTSRRPCKHSASPAKVSVSGDGWQLVPEGTGASRHFQPDFGSTNVAKVGWEEPPPPVVDDKKKPKKKKKKKKADDVPGVDAACAAVEDARTVAIAEKTHLDPVAQRISAFLDRHRAQPSWDKPSQSEARALLTELAALAGRPTTLQIELLECCNAVGVKAWEQCLDPVLERVPDLSKQSPANKRLWALAGEMDVLPKRILRRATSILETSQKLYAACLSTGGRSDFLTLLRTLAGDNGDRSQRNRTVLAALDGLKGSPSAAQVHAALDLIVDGSLAEADFVNRLEMWLSDPARAADIVVLFDKLAVQSLGERNTKALHRVICSPTGVAARLRPGFPGDFMKKAIAVMKAPKLEALQETLVWALEREALHLTHGCCTNEHKAAIGAASMTVPQIVRLVRAYDSGQLSRGRQADARDHVARALAAWTPANGPEDIAAFLSAPGNLGWLFSNPFSEQGPAALEALKARLPVLPARAKQAIVLACDRAMREYWEDDPFKDRADLAGDDVNPTGRAVGAMLGQLIRLLALDPQEVPGIMIDEFLFLADRFRVEDEGSDRLVKFATQVKLEKKVRARSTAWGPLAKNAISCCLDVLAAAVQADHLEALAVCPLVHDGIGFVRKAKSDLAAGFERTFAVALFFSVEEAHKNQRRAALDLILALLSSSRALEIVEKEPAVIRGVSAELIELVTNGTRCPESMAARIALLADGLIPDLGCIPAVMPSMLAPGHHEMDAAAIEATVLDCNKRSADIRSAVVRVTALVQAANVAQLYAEADNHDALETLCVLAVQVASAFGVASEAAQRQEWFALLEGTTALWVRFRDPAHVADQIGEELTAVDQLDVLPNAIAEGILTRWPAGRGGDSPFTQALKAPELIGSPMPGVEPQLRALVRCAPHLASVVLLAELRAKCKSIDLRAISWVVGLNKLADGRIMTLVDARSTVHAELVTLRASVAKHPSIKAKAIQQWLDPA